MKLAHHLGPAASRFLFACVITSVIAGGLAAVVTTPGSACRFWGLVGSGYPTGMIADQLRDGSVANLRDLGGMNRDGWGLGFYLPPELRIPLNAPIVRRGGPPANHPHDPDFDLAVEELANLRPHAAIGHVRAGSSGHWGIPDPHPFVHDGILFAHNGTVSEEAMMELLDSDGGRFLSSFPPDYVNGNIDSELYFLFLLKCRMEQPRLSRAESFRRAIPRIEEVSGMPRLNFVMTVGDTLYAMRCAPYDTYDAVRFYPANGGASPYWIAASQVLGSDETGWGTIPARTLAVFVPGHAPRFIPIDGDTAQVPDPEIVHVPPAHPNPVRTRLAVPISVPATGASVTVEVWDAQGRQVFRAGPAWTVAGDAEVVWDGRDRSGRDVPSGTYFCRVWVGGENREQRITVLR